MRISSAIYLLERIRGKAGDVKLAIITEGSKKTFKEILEIRLPNHTNTKPHNLCVLVASRKPGAEK